MGETPIDPKFESLLEYLQQSRGFDFTGYKRTSLMRRVSRRMETVGVHDYAEYQILLQSHAGEFAQLFNTILINVTSFFRDPLAWNLLAKKIIPDIIASRQTGKPIRVWCAGVASGEEAYSIAMLFAEALGMPASLDCLKIYATDIDQEALAQARQANYRPVDLEPVPEMLRGKYFERAGGRYTCHPDLRRLVIFGRHDLIQDAPISRLDLLISRNTLMYFNIETQSRILDHFHFALDDNGYLFLGKAEMLTVLSDHFAPVDARLRLFSKLPLVERQEPASFPVSSREHKPSQCLAHFTQLCQASFETNPLAQILVGLDKTLIGANQRARAFFRLSKQDIGRPFAELAFCRAAMLPPRMEHALEQQHPMVMQDIEYGDHDGAPECFDVHVMPLQASDGTMLGTSLTFMPATRHEELQRLVSTDARNKV